MIEAFCGYSGDRDEVLVAYVYDDIEPGERGRFEAHLAACTRCRREVSALGGVRRELARWSPPAPAFIGDGRSAVADPISRTSGGWWRDVPGWAQAGAALLLLGAAAGLANLDVRYDASGLTVRTGWSRGAAEALGGSRDRSAGGATAGPAASAPWRADLAAVEQQLRTELGQSQAARPAPAAAEADLLRRVRSLVEESERRQQRELALRVGDVMRDLDTQRRADLGRIDRSLGLIQSNAGVEVLKQRELLNYLVRASQSR